MVSKKGYLIFYRGQAVKTILLLIHSGIIREKAVLLKLEVSGLMSIMRKRIFLN